MDFNEYVKYGSTGIAAMVIFAGIYIARMVFQQSKDIREMNAKHDENNTAAYRALAEAIAKNTAVTTEMRDFMTNLNGSLRRAVQHKQRGMRDKK